MGNIVEPFGIENGYGLVEEVVCCVYFVFRVREYIEERKDSQIFQRIAMSSELT